jgi:hypothetical protein
MIFDGGIDFYRKQRRKKRGMTGTGRNLRAYLLSLGWKYLLIETDWLES